MSFLGMSSRTEAVLEKFIGFTEKALFTQKNTKAEIPVSSSENDDLLPAEFT